MSAYSGIRADGGRCQAQAMRNSEWCINHHPDRAEVRRRRASKGGKRGGRGRPIAELGSLRDENADIRRRLLEGELPPNVAAVAVQSINTDIRAVRAATKESRAAFEDEYGSIEMVGHIIAADYQGGWVDEHRLQEDGTVETTHYEGGSEETERIRQEARERGPAA